jgi:hypothetical protein
MTFRITKSCERKTTFFVNESFGIRSDRKINKNYFEKSWKLLTEGKVVNMWRTSNESFSFMEK